MAPVRSFVVAGAEAPHSATSTLYTRVLALKGGAVPDSANSLSAETAGYSAAGEVLTRSRLDVARWVMVLAVDPRTRAKPAMPRFPITRRP